MFICLLFFEAGGSYLKTPWRIWWARGSPSPTPKCTNSPVGSSQKPDCSWSVRLIFSTGSQGAWLPKGPVTQASASEGCPCGRRADAGGTGQWPEGSEGLARGLAATGARTRSFLWPLPWVWNPWVPWRWDALSTLPRFLFWLVPGLQWSHSTVAEAAATAC